MGRAGVTDGVPGEQKERASGMGGAAGRSGAVVLVVTLSRRGLVRLTRRPG